MDLKTAGTCSIRSGRRKTNWAVRISPWSNRWPAGMCPKSIRRWRKRRFAALHRAIEAGLVRACHDLSEGGLAVAVAEMALAGGLGARVFLEQVPHQSVDALRKPLRAVKNRHCAMPCCYSRNRIAVFSARCPADAAEIFEQIMGDVPMAVVGEVLASRGCKSSAPIRPTR